jgi:hypothetical protein
MWQFTITYNSITTVISEPIGWNETEIVIRRNKEFHGIFFEYSLNKLRYHGTAYTILKDAYETLGIDAEAELLIEYKCDDSDTFEEFYTGKFAFNQIKIEEGNGCFIEIPIEQIGCVNTFLNRKDQKVNLNSNLDFNEDALTAYAGLNESLAFPPKEIFLQNIYNKVPETDLEYTDDVIRLTGQPENYFFAFTFDETQNEIPTSNSIFDIGRSIPDYEVFNFDKWTEGYNGLIDVTSISQLYCFNESYNVSIKLKGTFTDSSVSTRLYDAYFVLRWGNENDGYNFLLLTPNFGFSSSGVNTYNFDIDVQTTVTMALGDRLYLYAGLLNYTYTTTIDYFDCSFVFDEAEVTVDTLSLCESTSSKVAYINEALSRTVEAITNDCIRVKSNYYGRTNSLPYSSSIDGCGGLRVITDGLNIRKKLLSDGTVPPITVSFDDMMNGLNPIDNIGYGIEDDPNRAGFKQLRVEPFDYFYDSSTSITLRKVPAIETTVDESRIYSQINIGYEKWESEEFNGLDEINTNRTYRTVLNSVKNTLTKISSFITSGYALEITRRNGTNSNDWRFDNDIFLVQLRRVGIGTFVEFFNTAQLLFANLLTPNTTYNIRLSPIRNLMRWFPIIQSSWSKQATSPIELKYTDGTANIKAETQILVNGCTAELNTFLLSESRNISKNDLLGVIADPLWEPEQIKFEFPLSYQQFKTLRQFPYKKIKILGNFGDRSGWIEQINYKPNTGIATFTLLKQYGS